MALELDFSKLSGTDILDMAIAIEDEAQLYYEQLADWVKKGTNGEAADFFNRMATREERHRLQIVAQRERLYGDAPASNAAKVSWAVEAPDYDAVPNDISLRQAFEVAMDAETRAEAFYAGISSKGCAWPRPSTSGCSRKRWRGCWRKRLDTGFRVQGAGLRGSGWGVRRAYENSQGSS